MRLCVQQLRFLWLLVLRMILLQPLVIRLLVQRDTLKLAIDLFQVDEIA